MQLTSFFFLLVLASVVHGNHDVSDAELNLLEESLTENSAAGWWLFKTPDPPPPPPPKGCTRSTGHWADAASTDLEELLDEGITLKQGWWWKAPPPPPPPVKPSCTSVSQHTKAELLKAAQLSADVYSEADFRQFKVYGDVDGVGKSLRVSFYVENGPHDIDFGEAVPVKGHEQAVWFAFAGTDSLEDAKTDAMATRYPIKHGMPGKVHYGMLRQWAAAREKTMAAVTHLKAQGIKQVYCVGHSLGGGIATMAAAEIQVNNRDLKVDLITIGQPAMSDKPYTDYMNCMMGSRMTRLVVGRDPVPCAMPPNFSYSLDGFTFWSEDTKSWRRSREDGCKSMVTWFRSNVSHHSSVYYIKVIENECL